MFILAGHKTGSTLLTDLIRDICNMAGIAHLPLEAHAFDAGAAVNDWPDDFRSLMQEEGFVFHSFRFFDGPSRAPNFWTHPKIVLIRDPRDCITSLYFSSKFSHPVPEAGPGRDQILEYRDRLSRLSIDDFVIDGHADWSLENYNRIAEISNRRDVDLFRYEDVIFEKETWVREICRLLNADLTQEQISEIVSHHDIRPEKERPDRHIRSVSPGNYKSKLSERSIEYIERFCPAYFVRMGYEPEMPRLRLYTSWATHKMRRLVERAKKPLR